MNCIEFKELLSAYHDGELSSDVHSAVGEHLKDCPECVAMLAGFRQLSDLSGQLAQPEPPDQWAAIEQQLAAALIAPRTREKRARVVSAYLPLSAMLERFVPRVSLAVAATVLIAAGLGVGAYYGWFSMARHHDEQLAANFDAFLTQFEQDPQAAQQVLLANYNGQQVDLCTAATLVGHQPAIAPGLPPGYIVDAVYVLDMPCCKCTQVICRCEGNGRLAIFEHDVDQPVWFRGRPAIDARCCGKPTRIVEMDGGLLAATWPSNKRYLTVIGAHDVEEVARIVAHFERTGENLQ